MRNSTRNYVKLIIHANCFWQAWPPNYQRQWHAHEIKIRRGVWSDKMYFNADELHEDQTRLIKAFFSGKNINFNAPTGYGSPAYKVNHIACGWAMAKFKKVILNSPSSFMFSSWLEHTSLKFLYSLCMHVLRIISEWNWAMQPLRSWAEIHSNQQ